MKNLKLNELELVNGGSKPFKGTYYGNGVYCSKEDGCRVDWAKATTCIAGMSIGGFLGGAIPGKC